MNHLLLGGIIPFSVAALIYILKGRRASLRMLIITPLAMAAFILWAIAPDLPRLFGFHTLYRKLADDPRCNIFFWHYTLDLTETDSLWHTSLFLIMLGLLLFAAWREIRMTGKGV